MTNFEILEEKRSREREQRRYAEIDGALAVSLATRSRAEVVKDLFAGLTFVVGSADILPQKQGELLVF